MKKFITIILITCNLIFADNINIDNQKVLSDLRLAGFNSITHNIQKENLKQILATYYLLSFEPKKFHKNINNEFEKAELLKEGFSTLKSLALQNYNKYINKNYVTYIWCSFGKYNFKTKSFPLTLGTGASFQIYQHHYTGTYLTLKFDNLSTDDEILKMDINNAKNLLSLHTGNYNIINRKLIAKYYFNIKSINSTIPEWDLNIFTSSKTLVIIKIAKIEILDKLQNDKILYTIYINKKEKK